MTFAPLDLISPAYREEQKTLHAKPRGYGAKGQKWVGPVLSLVSRFGASSVLDYGCGQGSLATALRTMLIPGLRVDEYDPAIPGKDHLPVFADIVTCTDVLEHVEPDRLDSVIRHLFILARKAVFLVVALDNSNKVLSDGRNAHLILESPEWWAAQVRASGLTVEEADETLVPAHYTPEKRAKRWIAVGIPA